MSVGLGQLGVLPLEVRKEIYTFLDLSDAGKLVQVNKEVREELYVLKCQNYSEVWKKLKEWAVDYFGILEERRYFEGEWEPEFDEDRKLSAAINYIEDTLFEEREIRKIGPEGEVSYEKGADFVLTWMNNRSYTERNLKTIETIGKRMAEIGPDFGAACQRNDIEYPWQKILNPFPGEIRVSIGRELDNSPEWNQKYFLMSPSIPIQALVRRIFYGCGKLGGLEGKAGELMVKPVLEKLLRKRTWNLVEEGIAIGCFASLVRKDLDLALTFIRRVSNDERIICELAEAFRQHEEILGYKHGGELKRPLFLEHFISKIAFKERSSKTQLELVKVMSKYSSINALQWAKEIRNEEMRNRAIVEILYHFQVLLEGNGVEGLQEVLGLVAGMPERFIKEKRGLKTIIKYLREVMNREPGRLKNLIGEPEGDNTLNSFGDYNTGNWRSFAVVELIREYQRVAEVRESDEDILELLKQVKGGYEYDIDKYREANIPPAIAELVTYAFHVRKAESMVELLQGLFSRIDTTLPHWQMSFLDLIMRKIASEFIYSSDCILAGLSLLEDGRRYLRTRGVRGGDKAISAIMQLRETIRLVSLQFLNGFTRNERPGVRRERIGRNRIGFTDRIVAIRQFLGETSVIADAYNRRGER